MPRMGITAYDLLLSCPGDVLEYIDIIREEVANFNRVFGILNNIDVVVKHWSTDSYPEAGDKPQKLLNEQFILDCDVVVAIFWSRFGTPTDKYQSGTEEEIEEMINKGKQVFLYFLDKPIALSEINLEQYNKVCNFKEKYEKDKGLYSVVHNEHELRKQFFNHLSLYFLKLVTGNNNATSIVNKPDLKIECLKVKENKVYYSQYKESEFCRNKEKEIYAIIEQIDNITITSNYIKTKNDKVEDDNSSVNIDTIQQNANISQIKNYFIQSSKKANIEKEKKEILKYFVEKNITVTNGFWDLGSLSIHKSVITLPYSNGESLEGTIEEEEKYKLIQKLYWTILDYSSYEEYFGEVDKMATINLTISNNGATFDEDIDIKIIVESGVIYKLDDFPIPESNIIEEVNNMNIVNLFFEADESDTIEKYSGYPIDIEIPQVPIIAYPYGESIQDKIERNQSKYNDKLEKIFCYKYFNNENQDILTFNIQYLKQNTTMHFPSSLVFKKVPKFIECEVRSKFTSNIIRFKINLDEKL